MYAVYYKLELYPGRKKYPIDHAGFTDLPLEPKHSLLTRIYHQVPEDVRQIDTWQIQQRINPILIKN
jgi:hypothetical protein